MFPYIVIAGGNGSFISVFDELIEKQIDPLKATFCILPFGNCNDLAQVTGWGADTADILEGSVLASLKHFVEELKYASISWINIWEIEAKCAVCVYYI